MENPIIKQEEVDISGDEFEEPFNEPNFGPILLKNEMLTIYGDRHGQEQLNQSEASVSVSPVEPSSTYSTQEQFTHLGTVTHPQNVECLEHKRPHCRLKGAIDEDACTRNIGIDEESIFEKSRNISLDVEVEASLSGEAERFEGQGIHPGESMSMTLVFQGDVAVTKEESGMEERKAGAEEGRGSAAEKGVEGERNSFKCYQCGKELMTKRGLTKHMELHGFGTSYESETYGMVFENNSKVISHAFTKTGCKQPDCVECCKSVSPNGIGESQLGSHLCYRQYKCLECNKWFNQSSHLSRHIRSHTGFKPYKCVECGKCFSQNYDLIRHERSHTGSKPYKCVECSKCFSQSSNLKTHMRSHTGTKPYQCIECNKCFSVRSTLNKHIRSHTGSKPYKCLKCSKSFSISSNLNKHMRSHMI